MLGSCNFLGIRVEMLLLFFGSISQSDMDLKAPSHMTRRLLTDGESYLSTAVILIIIALMSLGSRTLSQAAFSTEMFK